MSTSSCYEHYYYYNYMHRHESYRLLYPNYVILLKQCFWVITDDHLDIDKVEPEQKNTQYTIGIVNTVGKKIRKSLGPKKIREIKYKSISRIVFLNMQVFSIIVKIYFQKMKNFQKPIIVVFSACTNFFLEFLTRSVGRYMCLQLDKIVTQNSNGYFLLPSCTKQ